MRSVVRISTQKLSELRSFGYTPASAAEYCDKRQCYTSSLVPRQEDVGGKVYVKHRTFPTSALDGNECLISRPAALPPEKKHPVPIC
jgi:hypothetical protein